MCELVLISFDLSAIYTKLFVKLVQCYISRSSNITTAKPAKEVKKMLALKSVKDILRFMGLLMESDKKYSLHYVKNVLITAPMVVLLLPLCGYLVFNANNLLTATDVFYVIAATFLCIGQYWFLVVQKRPTTDLLSELQALIDQSKCQIKRFCSY